MRGKTNLLIEFTNSGKQFLKAMHFRLLMINGLIQGKTKVDILSASE